MAGLALKNLQQRVSSSSSLLNSQMGNRGVAGPQQQRWGSELLRRLSTAASEKVSDDKSSEGREVTVSEGDNKKFKLFPFRPRRGLWGRGLRKNDNSDHHLSPSSLHELFPSRLGNALHHAKESLNMLFKNLSPSGLIGRLKENDEAYKLRYEVPGLAKEDMKITIVDGLFLTIIGEHLEEEEDEEGSVSDEHYRYYDTILFLPEDAKIDEIKAEMKHGVLTITIPRSSEKPNKDVKEVKID